MKLFILFLVVCSIFAADVQIDAPKVDLNKPVKLFILDGMPGYVSQDGDTFMYVHGGKVSRVTTTGQPALDIRPVTLPYWLSRRPSKQLLEQMSDEQRAFWAKVSAEGATLTPLQNKLAQLNMAFNAAAVAVTNLQLAIVHEIQKATENHDTAALSSPANNNRRARQEHAAADFDRANKNLATWLSSPEHVVMMDSQQRMVTLWATQLTNTERKNP